MAIIKEIHKTHVIIEENSARHEVPIETIKFEPRVNDYVSLIRDDNGFITNVFLERKPEPEVIYIRQPQEQEDLKELHNQAINLAMDRSVRTISMFSIVLGFLSVFLIFGLIAIIINPAILTETLKQMGLDENLVTMTQIYVLLGSSILSSAFLIVFGFLTRKTKDRKRQRIYIIILLAYYALNLLSVLVSVQASLFTVVIILIPFINSITYLRNYNRLK